MREKALKSCQNAIDSLVSFVRTEAAKRNGQVSDSNEAATKNGILEACFDGSWSHRRNANESTAEIISPLNPDPKRYRLGEWQLTSMHSVVYDQAS